jgi:tetraspanin-5
MQMDFQCCGIGDPDDWDKNIYFNASAKALKSPEAGGVPYSCCKNLDAALINYACGYQTRVSQADNVGLGEEMARGGRDWLLHLQGPKQSYHSNIYTEGCLPKLQYWLNNNFLYVGAAIFVVAVIQVSLLDINGNEMYCMYLLFQFLGICFAQDLRSDIFAQRSKWSRQT